MREVISCRNGPSAHHHRRRPPHHYQLHYSPRSIIIIPSYLLTCSCTVLARSTHRTKTPLQSKYIFPTTKPTTGSRSTNACTVNNYSTPSSSSSYLPQPRQFLSIFIICHHPSSDQVEQTFSQYNTDFQCK